MKYISASTLAMTLFFYAWLPVAAQQAPAPKPPAATLSDDMNIDPTAETDNPTLLKAQILILQNAREAKRAVLGPLSDFQDFEKFDALQSQKQQKLNSIVRDRAQQSQQALAVEKAHGAQRREGQKADQAAEMEALAKANKEKAAEAAKEVAPKK